MKLGFKIAIVAVTAHISIILAFLLPVLIIFRVIPECFQSNVYSNINNTLAKYNKNDNMIIYDDNNIYYENNWNKTKELVCWIDNDNIIYYRYNEIINYYLVNNGETKILNENIRLNLLIDSFIYNNSYIYYYDYNKNYFKFDTISKNVISIDKNEYNIIRNGNKYIIDDSNFKKEIIITDIENNKIKQLTNTSLFSNEVINELKEKCSYDFFDSYYYNYYINNDSIYFTINVLIERIASLSAFDISLTFNYNFEDDTLNLYNWIILNNDFSFPYHYSLAFIDDVNNEWHSIL